MQENVGPQKRRLTIGLLNRQVSDEIGAPLWAGVAHAARQRDLNLITFSGGSLRDPEGFRAQGNRLFDLAGPENVDGLIAWTGIIGHYISRQELDEFCGRYAARMPMVTIEVPVPGIPGVVIDFYQGMHSLVSHLIEDHGYRRIAFIRGPEGALTGEERYRGYVDALAEHGIELDPDLVAPGTFLAPAGAEAVRLLLDERKAQFEALAAANDTMAMSAMEALQARGIHAPDDLAVTGFDDVTEARSAIPPLTTCKLPFFEMGCQAVELLLARLEGQPVPDQLSLRTPLVVRQSCGCPDPLMAQAGRLEGWKVGRLETFERSNLATVLVEAMRAQDEAVEPAMAGRLVDALYGEMSGGTPGQFTAALDGILRWVMLEGGQVGAWHAAVSALRQAVLPPTGSRATKADLASAVRAEDLFQQARVLISETAQRAETYGRIQAERQAAMQRRVGQEVAAARDLAALAGALGRELPGLGIGGACVSLYQPGGALRMLAACDGQGPIEPEDPRALEFPASQLVPEGIWTDERPHCVVVEPLYSAEEQLGIAVLEVDQGQEAMCDPLREQISSALMGALLTEQARRRALQLQTAAQISATASSVLEPNELIQQAVNLVRSQFGLYYVGLFLVDADGRFAVLRAGTGDAGREMIARGHKLEIADASMIGWCIAHRRARVALDVGKEAVHAYNPLLPDTRSELAMPLLSRGDAIGALTVQSTQRAAFGAEDVAVFQTMADQLANAIANAHLFEQTQTALNDMEGAQRRYLRQAWQSYAAGEQAARGYQRSSSGEGPTADAWLPAMADAVRDNRTVVRPDDGQGQTLALPLTLAGEIMGAVGGSSARSEAWTAEEIAAAEAIASQMALAVENQRLFDEAQRASALMSERVRALDCLNDISRKVEETPPIPEFLAWAANRVPMAMRYAGVCVATLEMEDQVYGSPEALALPCQMVHRLVVGGRPAGRLTIAYREEHEFLDEESALLGEVVRRVDGYLDNRHLFEQVQAGLAEAQKLYNASRRLAVAGDVQAVVASVAEELPLPSVNRAIIWTVHYDAGDRPEAMTSVATWHAGWGTPPMPLGIQFPFSTFPAIRVGLGSEPVFVDDALRDERLDPATRAVFAQQHVHAVALLPMWAGGRQIALFMLVGEEPHQFTEQEMRPYRSLVPQMAIALENRRLFDETRASLARSEALYRASSVANVMEELPDVLQSIATGVAEALPADRVLLLVVDRERRQVANHAWAGPGSAGLEIAPYDELWTGLTGWVLREGKPAISPKGTVDARESPEAQRRRSETNSGSIIVVPLTFRGELLGTLTAINRVDQPDFSLGLELMTTMASQAAAAVVNARLFQQTEQALAETGRLYNASSALNAASSYDAVLTTLREQSMLGEADRNITLELFDQPWTEEQVPDWTTAMARYSTLPEELQTARYPLRGSPMARLLAPDWPTIVEDTSADQRLDAEARELYEGRCGARSVITVPLLVGGQWIGIIEALFSQPRRFDAAEVQRLTILAGQAAVAVQNLRQFEQVQAALAEVEATHRRYLQGRWQAYLQQREALVHAGYLYDQDEGPDRIPAVPGLWRPEMGEALRSAAPARAVEGGAKPGAEAGAATEQASGGSPGRTGLAVPITLRGQAIGVLGVEDPNAARDWSEEELALLEEVGQQLALALENARLFEETQRRAERERLITEITARIRSSTDILGVLETTANELGRALGTSRAMVRLTVEEK